MQSSSPGFQFIPSISITEPGIVNEAWCHKSMLSVSASPGGDHGQKLSEVVNVQSKTPQLGHFICFLEERQGKTKGGTGHSTVRNC